MKHVVGIITQAIAMIFTYVTVLLSLVFDAIVFALPIILVYNFTLVTKFGAPELLYLDIVGLVLLVKLIAVLWKSVKSDAPQLENLYSTDDELKEE